MEEYKKVIWVGIIVISLIGFGFGIYYFFFHGKSEAPLYLEEVKEEPSEAQAEEQAKPEGERVLTGRELNLNKSDSLVRRLAVKLSSHKKTTQWLRNEDLVRKFVAVVDNIAYGMSPRVHLEFLAPQKQFQVVKRGNLFYLNPASFSRYNLAAEVFASLNTEECVKLYWELKPLIQEAYLELGYPNRDFHDTLFRTTVELLETPIVDDDIVVEKKVVTYMMVDPKLESLSEGQKHLLRMGSGNVRKIQAKLRDFARIFGFEESQLPEPAYYTPRRGR